MAVDEGERRRDMYEAHLGPDDERIQFAGWVYYVRAVKWERDFTHGLVQPAGDLFIDSIRLAAQGLRKARARRRPWEVGVVRMGDVSTWNDPAPRLVYRESLVPGHAPRARIAELAQQARDGAFAPGS